MSKEQYSSSEYIFKGDEGSNKLFFMTRVISTHIRYIERFRHFINDNYDEIISTKLKNFPADKSKYSKEYLHNYFFEYIERYIYLMKKSNDPYIGQIPDRLLDKLKEVRKNPEKEIDLT